jgi:short subunit dehydrogenase-like uncharacterized protein
MGDEEMRETTYDVVLYGASGFVGKQTVRYFAEHAGDEVRWAIAGRDRQKLELVKESDFFRGRSTITFTTLQSTIPKPLKLGRSKFGITHCMLNIVMP